jgi:T5SS/PEP-CTERM-associated repeat protein
MTGQCRSRRFRWAALLAATLVLAVPRAVLGVDYTWTNAGGGYFPGAGNWSPSGYPWQSSDTATFNIPGTYTVGFTFPVTNLDSYVNQGAVTFTSYAEPPPYTYTPGGPWTYTLIRTGGDGIANITGGTLTLGTLGSPLNISAANRTWVQTGGSMWVTNGSYLSANNLGLGRLVGGNTSLVIDGTGSQLTTPGNNNTLGESGASGSLTLQNGASGSLGATYLAYSGVNSTGNITVQSTASLSLANLAAATGGLSGQSATITVTGSGSTITQSGASELTLGAGSNSPATLSVLSSGTFTTGTGWTALNTTGNVNVNGGTFNVLGPISVNGGSLTTSNAGSFIWSPSQTMNFYGGTVNLGSSYTLPTSAIVRVWNATSTLQTATGASLTVSNLSQLNVAYGGSVVSGNNIDVGIGTSGTLLVDGPGSNVTVNGPASCRWGGGGSTGTVTFSNGASGTINTNVSVGADGTGTGTLLVGTGATLSLGGLAIGGQFFSSATGTVTVTGAGSAITQTPATNLFVGDLSGGPANLNVNSGGSYTVSATGNTYLNPTGAVTINGGYANLGILNANGGALNFTAGSLSYLGNLTVGLGGLLGQSLSLNSSRSVTLSGQTTIDPFQSLVLTGGTLSTGSLVNNGTFNFTSGTLGISGSSGLTFVASGGPLGTAFTLGTGCNLSVTNATTIPGDSSLTIDGGQITSGSLDNAGSLIFQRGGLSVGGTLTNQTTGRLTISSLGSLRTPGAVTNNGRIELLGGAANLGGSGALTNGGLILGDGEIAKNTTNSFSGEIRGESGKHLLLAGSNGSNAGLITLANGDLQFSQALTNSGTITGRGQLRVGGAGLTNNGNIAFSAGITDLYAKVTNNSGPTPKIITSGGGATNFWDDVVNNGEIRTSAGCRSTFFGSTSGSGTYTGTGTVDFEGDLRPGSSPAAVSIGGNAVFGGSARLEIELGGSTPGTQYDKVQVANNVSLDGRLDVKLISPPYRPSHNDQFEVLTFGSRTGDFASTTGLDLGSRLTLVPQYTSTSLKLTAAQGGSGSWRFDSSGNASVSTNWDAAIPNGAGDVATLGPVITTAQIVAVDQPTTLGGLVFNNDQRYTLAGPQTLTLDNGLAAATIQVAGLEGHTISASLSLASDLLVQANGGRLTLGGAVNNPSGKQITILGGGGVSITAAQNYGSGTVLQFGGGGSAPSGGPAPVPEPGTIVLLLTAAACRLVSCCRRLDGF